MSSTRNRSAVPIRREIEAHTAPRKVADSVPYFGQPPRRNQRRVSTIRLGGGRRLSVVGPMPELFGATAGEGSLLPGVRHGSRTVGRRHTARRRATAHHRGLLRSHGLDRVLDGVDAEDFAEFIQGYHERAVGIADRFGGAVESYSGDGILFRFGWPLAHDDDPERAVRAALEIVADSGKPRRAATSC